ncbi:MAG: MinD/ParA family protein [Gemmatimonadales bacterium]
MSERLRLRQEVDLTPAIADEPMGPPVVVIGSGKGGVGKSSVAVLAAQAMANDGGKVLLVDGSQNLGHLHVLLDVPMRARLSELARGHASPDALLVQVSERLWLLPSDSGAEGLYALGALESARLHHRLCDMYDGFDTVVVDAGPGIEGVVRLATMRGTRLVVVTVPEPAALTDAYALIKLVHLQLPTLRLDLLVNRVTSESEGVAAYTRLAEAAERFLGRSIGWLGAISEAPAMLTAARRPGGLLKAPELQGLRREIAALVHTGAATVEGGKAS